MSLNKKNIIGKCIRSFIPYLPHRIAHTYLFWRNHGYLLDWNNPKTYDEKLTWALAYLFSEKEALFADKYRVREYVAKCGFEELLPEVYNVWENADEISLDKLPNSFILKANHACGDKYYEIIRNKDEANIIEIRKKFMNALDTNIWKSQCEYHYKYIKPLIFAEQLLDDGKGLRMVDYKIHCFNGEPFCILVCSNREDELKLDYYDLSWNYLDVVPEKLRSGYRINKPLGLDTMLYAARKMSSIFPTARIDFYDIKGKVYFGEITLSPAGGNLHYICDKWQHILGDKINYDNNNKSFVLNNDYL